MIREESIVEKIYKIRGTKVMVDRDLAVLYGVETRVLNQAVRRNIKRFPEDFMFQMTQQEMQNWISQFVISKDLKMSLRKPPLAFTEQGVAMLSSVLNSDRAILVNIEIIRVFTKMRSLLETHSQLLKKIEKLQQKDLEQDEKILIIFKYLRQLQVEKSETENPEPLKKIGFRRKEK